MQRRPRQTHLKDFSNLGSCHSCRKSVSCFCCAVETQRDTRRPLLPVPVQYATKIGVGLKPAATLSVLKSLFLL